MSVDVGVRVLSNGICGVGGEGSALWGGLVGGKG